MTGSTPPWVSITALAVAGFALLVAAAAAGISYLSYRASGPRLRVEATVLGGRLGERQLLVSYTVINQGRAEASVLGFYVGSERFPVPIDAGRIISGDALPVRILGNAQRTWSLDVLPALRYIASLPKPPRVPLLLAPYRFLLPPEGRPRVSFLVEDGAGRVYETKRGEDLAWLIQEDGR